MENLEKRFTDLENKIDSLAGKITTGFEAVSENLKSLEKRIDILKGSSVSDLGTVETTVNKGFDEVASKINKINLDSIKVWVT